VLPQFSVPYSSFVLWQVFLVLRKGIITANDKNYLNLATFDFYEKKLSNLIGLVITIVCSFQSPSLLPFFFSVVVSHQLTKLIVIPYMGPVGKGRRLAWFSSKQEMLDTRNTPRGIFKNKILDKIYLKDRVYVTLFTLIPLAGDNVQILILILLCVYVAGYCAASSLDYFTNRVDSQFERSKNFIQQYQPELVLYGSGMAGAGYQVNQWLQVFEKLDKRCLILVRERHFLSDLGETSLPVVWAKKHIDLDDVLIDSVKAILYPANGLKNVQAFRWHGIKHMFINHGESDKLVNVSKMLRCYDSLFVAGQLASKRFLDAGLGIDKRSIQEVGRPQLEFVLTKKQKVNDLKTMLYAPTWEGFSEAVNYCSISNEMVEAIEMLLAEDCRILVKLHPFTGSQKPELRKLEAKLRHLANKYENLEFHSRLNIHNLMNMSDFLLCDISSVLNDYLFTEKPIILTNPQGMCSSVLNDEYPSSRAAYVLDNPLELVGMWSEINSNDHKEEARGSVRMKSLGDYDKGKTLERFSDAIDQTIND